jgi:subtilisin family serine protease
MLETLKEGRQVRWTRFAELLKVPHEGDGAYHAPDNEHGTHVAGILAGDWRRDDVEVNDIPRPEIDVIGVCPTLQLYDLRVFGSDGTGTEYAVLAAIEFLQALTNEREELTVQGVNMSFSIRHDVANYACGRTPVCDAVTKLVNSGVVVVAAAGNDGYWRPRAGSTEAGEGYRTVSITDPGNTEAAITVGSTHSYRPYAYGVSYFSSRGPTGDGRAKPDLVAPGEKISSAVPDGRVLALDGTSMATPHVSGCAALLMARYRELIGDPDRIKSILTATASDLGRESYFQGHGLVDVLRAMQSI